MRSSQARQSWSSTRYRDANPEHGRSFSRVRCSAPELSRAPRSRRTSPEGLLTGQPPCPHEERTLRSVSRRLLRGRFSVRRPRLPLRLGQPPCPCVPRSRRHAQSTASRGHVPCPRIVPCGRNWHSGEMQGQPPCPCPESVTRKSALWITVGHAPCPCMQLTRLVGQPWCPWSPRAQRNSPSAQSIGQAPCPSNQRGIGAPPGCQSGAYRVRMLMASPAPRATG